ncbi:hypothetical protein IG197_05210 [Aminobacter sp. SR38]|jgi:5-methylcytosine-specific restriction endonuclease McrA|uniref:hypothetical protein n=1 Tax=Aminobacter sp. SR38 TaxID=2774562 RepID=UPI0017817061|nr:hypothetical protein [Aminobacter sp. SR38]QOF72477.1 hypothetical protein IG197_05210 [Aminobacter sp. SR38]
MKKFAHSSKGQYRALAAVASTKRGRDAEIATRMAFFAKAYREYVKHRGNPWLMTGQVPDAAFRNAMAGMFGARLAALSYIAKLRNAARGRCCSMCGSLNSNQVDHFLPQHHYPEFSLFLPNLFPVCSCNQSKGNKTLGPDPGERFLHPKFDRKIGERALYVRIRCHDDAPTYTVVARKPKGVRDAAAFDFHTRTLVSHDALADHVKDGFERFCRRPGNVVRAFKRTNPGSKAVLTRLLRDELDESCWQHRSKNNWDSVFLHALLERRTLAWIWRRMSAPGRVAGSPLVRL